LKPQRMVRSPGRFDELLRNLALTDLP